MNDTPSTAAHSSVATMTVRIRCDRCADVDVPLPRIELTEIDVPGRSWYAFQCPRCNVRMERPAGPDVCSVMRSLVRTTNVSVPPEALELRLPVPLTTDDVLDALAVLHRSRTPADLLRAWVLAVEAGTRSTDTETPRDAA
ncbi:MAG: hypothetical protein QOE05_2999 [Actinomycetota bacterium]|jgi:hypothetical protein|nr:hypothetical protein [Actinomycetota bacterium]